MSRKTKAGFTLIELLIVIAIIGVLSNIVLVSLSNARVKAREAKAKSELSNIRNAIAILAIDTNRWPNGCPIGSVYAGATNEVDLSQPEAGLTSVPPIGPIDPPCEWLAQDVAAWAGPYTNSSMVDPWGNQYWFDNDYYPLEDCPTPDANVVQPVVVIVSSGPNGVGGANNSSYDCDDVYVPLY